MFASCRCYFLFQSEYVVLFLKCVISQEMMRECSVSLYMFLVYDWTWCPLHQREVASSANSCANCHLWYLSIIMTHSVRHTARGNRFQWLYINCFQSPWFQYIIIESGIFLWGVVSREGSGDGGLHVSKEREDIKKRGGGEKRKGPWGLIHHSTLWS